MGALKSDHKQNTLGNKVKLIRRIYCSKLEEKGNMEDHIEKLTNLFQKLRDLGDESSECWIVGMI